MDQQNNEQIGTVVEQNTDTAIAEWEKAQRLLGPDFAKGVAFCLFLEYLKKNPDRRIVKPEGHSESTLTVAGLVDLLLQHEPGRLVYAAITDIHHLGAIRDIKTEVVEQITDSATPETSELPALLIGVSSAFVDRPKEETATG